MGCNCKARYSGEDVTTANVDAHQLANPVQPTMTPLSWVVPALLAGAAFLIFWGTLTRGKAPQ